ncbi:MULTISPECIES: NAD(P)-dependent oxidoreductase [Rhodomicrobium]|uniref:NAD(P)-dependent oxidoreductase n=1 Tax=Rhodomicrobium TaxID=1068 RepID=UPI000B4BA4A5|nr:MULTISPECIES: NAD(P)-dependent oxidoreductase [Rhodomicrobium]
MKIGICGTGRMGAAMAQRLLEVGHEVTVWNRDAAKTEPLTALGAVAAGSPGVLAGGVDCIISVLLNADAIDAVYRGAGGVLSADITGKLVIDMSTVLPEIEEALGRDVAARGGRFVECPVGGTVGPAREGKLLGLAGAADADFALARPLLDQLCRRVEHVGPVGAGAKMKLAVNLPLMVYWQALGEALSLCKPLGLLPERVIDILSDTSGTPTAMKLRGPSIAALLAGAPAGQPAFDLGAATKDLVAMTALAEQLRVAVPVTQAATACYQAAMNAGLAAADPVNLPVFWSERGGRI